MRVTIRVFCLDLYLPVGELKAYVVGKKLR